MIGLVHPRTGHGTTFVRWCLDPGLVGGVSGWFASPIPSALGGMAHTTKPLLQREGVERGAAEGQDWYSPIEYGILYESLVRRTPRPPGGVKG